MRYTIEDLPTFLTVVPLFALWYRMDYKKRIERYFFIYLCSKLCIELVMFWMAVEGQNNLPLYNAFVLISYCLLSRMAYEAVEHKIARRVILGGSATFLLTFFYDIYDVGVDEVGRYSGTVQCLLMIMYCVIFFAWLAHTLKIPNLLESPVFWIFSGILCYYSSITFATPVFHLIEKFGVGAKHDLYVMVLASYVMESIYLTVVGLGFLNQSR